jgi:hypothetical protein
MKGIIKGEIMNDKIDKLSDTIVNYSLRLKPYEKVLITYQDINLLLLKI